MPRLKTLEEKNEYVKSLKGTMSDTELRRKVREIFKVGKSQGNEIFRKIFDLNSSGQTVSGKKTSFLKEGENINPKPASFQETNGTGIAEVVGDNVKTLEDLLNVCQIDLNEWKVEKYLVNKWATARSNKSAKLTFNDGVINGFTNDDGGMTVQPIFQVKAWLVKRREVQDKKYIVEQFRKALQELSPVKFEKAPERSGFLYEIAMPDIHIGKLAWAEETKGSNYDSSIAVNRAKEAVATLVSYVDINKVEKFLLPIGNDFFNSDNAAATTTAGTPQSEDSRWQNTFMKGAKLLTEVINYLTIFAPVDIVIVQGNHDHERSFYLGEYLSAWFREHPSVVVNNEPSTRKYYRWHENLIGMTHGNEEKHADLPLIMATERPEDWAKSKWKYFQLGHWHREKLEDIKGVKVHVLPSFCEQDAWHTKKGYVGSDRAAEGLLFDKQLGLVANYYYRVS